MATSSTILCKTRRSSPRSAAAPKGIARKRTSNPSKPSKPKRNPPKAISRKRTSSPSNRKKAQSTQRSLRCAR